MRWNHLFPVLFVTLWILLGIYILITRASRGLKDIPIISNFHSPIIKDGLRNPTLLSDLGFVFKPRLYPQSYHADISEMPVFIAAVSAHTFPSFLQFVITLRLFYPDKKLVIYNLNLSKEQRLMVLSDCRCLIRDVHWTVYPKHVQNLQYQAYRPVLIQKALMEFGVVFWCEHTVRFTSAELPVLLGPAEHTGVLAWPIMYPTSAFTHYHMFRYFNTTHEQFYFHKMVETDGILLFNTEKIHRHLMLPWVKCALSEDCIAPKGAHTGACNLHLQPHYLYTGCHRYDMAAFNVVLGLLFNSETPYIATKQIYKVSTSV